MNNDMLIASSWSTMVQSTLNHAATMSQLCSATAADLMQSEAQQFVNQPAPTTQAELQLKHSQRNEFSSRISAISHADSMAKLHPDAFASIFDALREFLNYPYPTDTNISMDSMTRRSQLSSTISQLCNADLNAKMRASIKR